MTLSPALLWFVASVVCFGLEMLSTTCALLFFGFGGLAAWLAASLGCSLEIQIATFAIVSLVSLIFLRSKIKALLMGSSATSSRTVPTSALAGMHAKVTQPITAGSEGQVQVSGSFWRATMAAGSAPAGTEVIVEGPDAEDALLLVVHVRN